jgi:uncharacterized membrane protein YhaH (DUF805 family)
LRAADLLLSFDGRVDRARWLKCVAAILALIVGAYVLAGYLHGAGAIGAAARDAIRIFVSTALVLPWLALDWKRFHDLGRQGAWAVLCPGLHALSRLWDLPNVAAAAPAHHAVRVLLSGGQLLLALVLIYLLAFLPGTPGDNAYGPDPSASPPVPIPE